jgi:hypothetical protein
MFHRPRRLYAIRRRPLGVFTPVRAPSRLVRNSTVTYDTTRGGA